MQGVRCGLVSLTIPRGTIKLLSKQTILFTGIKIHYSMPKKKIGEVSLTKAFTLVCVFVLSAHLPTDIKTNLDMNISSNISST